MRIFPKRKIHYNSLKISLSSAIARLQSLLFSVPVILLSLHCTGYLHSHKTTFYGCLFSFL